MATLVKIISRCDIAVLQEVMDAKGQAVPALLRALNSVGETVSPESYSALSSPPLGVGRYREHYIFVYWSSRTQVLDSYMYPDESPARPDTFSREPFFARFSLPSKALPALVLVPLHMVPTKAELEVDTLYDVFLELQARWGTQALEVSDHYPVEVELNAVPGGTARLPLALLLAELGGWL